MAQKTPLYEEHVALKAKIIPFGDWAMPVSYASVIQEHQHVRKACGIFDVSHMGEVRVTGQDALSFLQRMTTNDVAKLAVGGGQYSALLNADGGFIDDLIVYRLGEEEFFLCVNASNVEKDFSWISSHAKEYKQLKVVNESSQWAQIAIQGPETNHFLKKLPEYFPDAVLSLPYTGIFQLKNNLYIARTGYTGEFGYEVYLAKDLAVQLWKSLLSVEVNGKKILPCGLGARDTLRLESCYLLYGNDMNETITPLEAGIGWAVKLGKGPFIGKEPLVLQKEKGLKRELRCLIMEEGGIPRGGMTILSLNTGQEVGFVTSGSFLPTLEEAGCMGYIRKEFLNDEKFLIDIRGQKKSARKVPRPFYQAKTK